MTEKKKYDSTVARIAGNIGASRYSARDLHGFNDVELEQIARSFVRLARAIVAETQRTEPKGDTP